MKIKSLFLGFTYSTTCLGSPTLSAVEMSNVCLTVGTSNNGKVLGVRIKESASGLLKASIEEVTLFHHVIVNFDQRPLKTTEVKKANLFGDTLNYHADDFDLIVNSQSRTLSNPHNPHNPYQEVGRLRTTINGSLVSAAVIEASDINSGYCD